MCLERGSKCHCRQRPRRCGIHIKETGRVSTRPEQSCKVPEGPCVLGPPELRQHHQNHTAHPLCSKPPGGPLPAMFLQHPLLRKLNITFIVKERDLKECWPLLQNMYWGVNLELKQDKLITGVYHKRILLMTSHLQLATLIKSKKITSVLWSTGNFSENLHYKQ